MRNILKYVSYKDKKEFANDLKTTYHALSEEIERHFMEKIAGKWEGHYPNAMKSWKVNGDAISPIFKFSTGVCKVTYTTQ